MYSKMTFDATGKWKRRALKASKISDDIIEAFVIPPRKAFIDEEIDLLTTEESQERLAKLLGFLAILLSIMSIALLFLLQNQHQSQHINFVERTSGKSKLNFPLPKIVIIDQVGNGTILEYSIDKNQTLYREWSLKLPSPKLVGREVGTLGAYFKKSTRYFAFAHYKKAVIIGVDGQKDTTITYSNRSHRTISNSKYPFRRTIGSSSVRSSKYFWIFEGHDAIINNDHTTHGKPYDWLWQESYLWSIDKQKYLVGPAMPKLLNKPSGGSCGIALNSSHVLVLFLTYDPSFDYLQYGGYYDDCVTLGPGCLAGWIYDFDNWKWSHLQWCIKGFVMEIFSKVVCTSYFTKNIELLIMTWVSNASDKIKIANPDGQIIEEIQLSNHLHHVSLSTSQGIVFMFSVNHDLKEVIVSIFNAELGSFVKKQQIKDFAAGIEEDPAHKYEELQLSALAL